MRPRTSSLCSACGSNGWTVPHEGRTSSLCSACGSNGWTVRHERPNSRHRSVGAARLACVVITAQNGTPGPRSCGFVTRRKRDPGGTLRKFEARTSDAAEAASRTATTLRENKEGRRQSKSSSCEGHKDDIVVKEQHRRRGRQQWHRSRTMMQKVGKVIA
ncbi:hypothetical protein MTO96_020915 [Rhipicephalus appendiculatus]